MPDTEESETEESVLASAISALPMRSIGPAFMGGRIADIAVHPTRPTTWYVAVGSGGVWRTANAGITWDAIFEDQISYSVGCVRIDPTNPEVIWVGTGEDVSGRHVAWGDGVYRSGDEGATWTHMGLKDSEHISDILIDPRDSNTVYVAAEGPLWSSGGERGLYKTSDGGASWQLILEVDDNTGVTSAVFAPNDPDVIYAATYQRRRRVWAFLAGGPGSGIHKSTDAGGSFAKIAEGLPKQDMGRIGLAVTPAAPDVVYATIEAVDKDERGFYRSTNRGGTWERRSEYLSGGTGPHYYQKIFASPINPDRVYTADVFVNVTNDGGKTFTNLETGKTKHSDNHVVWIDPANGQHLIVGSDAGLYETFDDGVAFRHVSNLPISQFYKVAVDNSVPFTKVLAGAQDLGTLSGPIRTLNLDGVRNQDWYAPLGADGYHVAFDPEDTDISYMEWQVGNVMRHNSRTMELTDIQPQSAPDDPPERWNWEVPIVVSPHNASRIYVASQRLWRSEDRGDSWTAISPDLTTNANRYELTTGAKVASVDSLYDHEAMSLYSSITAVVESPVAEGVLYVGTDDGRIHVSEDGGETWRQTERPPGLPETAFINDLTASMHDPDVVMIAADDHKSGDYAPYLFRSADRGRSWELITGDLPGGIIVWSIEEDHVKSQLLFLGAENGVYVTVDAGEQWHKLKDMPTIAFRDLAIQRRDNDLVCASFGRGIYVLDDYSALRDFASDALGADAHLFEVRDAWWYVPYRPMQSAGQPTLGSTAFRTPNPEFGATFTYHLGETIKSGKEARRDAEKEKASSGKDISFPGWDVLGDEHLESKPAVFLVVADDAGNPIRRIAADCKAGLHRGTWDLRHPAPEPIKLETPAFVPPWATPPKGALAAPGRYSVELVRLGSDGTELLAGPQAFSVVPIPAVATHSGSEHAQTFRSDSSELSRAVTGAAKQIEMTRDRVKKMRASILAAPGSTDLLQRLEAANRTFENITSTIIGDPVRANLAEAARPSINELIGRVSYFQWDTSAPPTSTQQVTIERAQIEFEQASRALTDVLAELGSITSDLDAAGGTWTPR